MAIIKITSPLATAPNVFASPVINQLLALAVDCNHGYRIGGGVVKKGSLWNIGGVMFIADADTPINGSKNQGLSTCAMAIKFTVSGDTATASYVNDLTGVTWNGEYQGYYDASGNMYYYKCKKKLREEKAVFVDPLPRATTLASLVSGSKSFIRTKIEKTGSYYLQGSADILAMGFGLVLQGFLKIAINGAEVYTYPVTTGTSISFSFPLFLEEDDDVHCCIQFDSNINCYGLGNDTFGSGSGLAI